MALPLDPHDNEDNPNLALDLGEGIKGPITSTMM